MHKADLKLMPTFPPIPSVYYTRISYPPDACKIESPNAPTLSSHSSLPLEDTKDTTSDAFSHISMSHKSVLDM
ncbi:unnamed protein product [Protopolystoma xenopodis]|uniref:Uncharacterized protein n=1 Tax=Protopolystoma xenopodis TaxID=117903 RepID=A0A3S5ARV3_9PLAT|nr:unnamed protein product [Protopolystoma xenopodis]